MLDLNKHTYYEKFKECIEEILNMFLLEESLDRIGSRHLTRKELE